jgi:hypothetical protein
MDFRRASYDPRAVRKRGLTRAACRNFEHCEAESRRQLDSYRNTNTNWQIGLAQTADAI